MRAVLAFFTLALAAFCTGIYYSPVSPDLPPVPLDPAPAEQEDILPYLFGTPLEEGPEAEDPAFENAVFLGDSRTEGLQLWGGLRAGHFYWSRGMTVFRVEDESVRFNVDGESLTMIGLLEKKQYDKIYIMLGVNELGWPADSYRQGLSRFLDKVLALQPGGVVYLQTLPPLNDALARRNLASYENNETIDTFNEIIRQVAAEKRVVLLDTAEAYRDADGQLPAALTSDGCHFTAGGYAIWVDYLRCHVIDPARYFYSRDLP